MGAWVVVLPPCCKCTLWWSLIQARAVELTLTPTSASPIPPTPYLPPSLGVGSVARRRSVAVEDVLSEADLLLPVVDNQRQRNPMMQVRRTLVG